MTSHKEHADASWHAWTGMSAIWAKHLHQRVDNTQSKSMTLLQAKQPAHPSGGPRMMIQVRRRVGKFNGQPVTELNDFL